MASSIEIDVSANIAKFKTAMDKAAIEGQNLNKKLDRAFTGVQKGMKAVGALAGVAVAGGLGTLAKQAINAADEIEKLSRRTGGSVKFLSEMRFALSQNDVSMKEFETSLRKINKSTADASAGLSTQTRAFGALGIKVEDFQKLDTDKKFVVLSEAISKVKDPALRTQAAMDIMGRSGEALITVMENGSAGIAEYRKEAERLGLSLSQDQADKAAAANDAIDKLTKSMSGAFTQAVLDNIGWIEKLGETFDNAKLIGIAFIEGLLIAFETFKGNIQIVGEAVKLAFVGAFDLILEANATMVRKIGEGMNFIKEGSGDALTGFADSISNILTPLDDYNKNVAKIKKETEAAKKEVKEITGDMADQVIQSKLASKAIAQTSDETADFTFQNTKANNSLKESKAAIKAAKDAHDGFFKSIDDVKTKLKELTAIHGQYANANEEVNAVLFEGYKAEARRKSILKEVQAQIESGKLSQEKANEVLRETGVITDEVGEKTVTMADHWRDFSESAYSSLETFYRTGFKDTESFTDSIGDLFKDMAAGVLAQLTALVASNAFKMFVSYVSGGKYGGDTSGGLWAGVGEMFGATGGGTGGGNGGGSSLGGSFGGSVGGAVGVYSGGSQIATGYDQIQNGDTAGGAMNLASGVATTYQGGVQLGLWGGASTTSGAMPTALALGEGAATTTSGAVAAEGSAAAGGSSAASIAGWAAVAILADQYLNNGRVTNAFGVEAEGRYQGVKDLFDGDFSGFTKSLYQPAYDAIKATFGGQGTDSLGNEQLGEVINSLESGSTQALALTGSTNFLGGFNDETTFFQTMVEGLDMAKVSALIEERLGFSDVREIADGILRLEDLGGSFEQNSDQIISNVLASISEVEIGFSGVERAAVKHLGDSVLEMDRVYDSLADSGMDAQTQLLETIKEVYGKSDEEAKKWVDNSVLTADRWKTVFNSASGQVLTDVINTFGEAENSVVGALGAMADSANDNFTLIKGGLYGVAEVAQETSDETIRYLRSISFESNQASNSVTAQAESQTAAAVNNLASETKKLNNEIRDQNQRAGATKRVS